MSTVTDPCDLFVTLITSEWSTTTGGVVPVVSQEWYSQTPQRTTLRDSRMRSVRMITLKELSQNMITVAEAMDEVVTLLQLDLWAESRADANQLRDEVKRILRANEQSPVTGVSAVLVTDWTDTSTFDDDQLYRWTATLELNYEEE